MSRKGRYIPSILLNSEENDTIMNLHDERWENQATAVVQLMCTRGPRHSTWHQKLAGVACFIKDHYYHSYFIRIFVFPEKTVEWEQEIYADFMYKKPKEFFHTFEADQCMAGLNFASKEEAHTFATVVFACLRKRSMRKTIRQRQISEGSSLSSSSSSFSRSTPNLASQMSVAPPEATHSTFVLTPEVQKKRKSKKKKNRKRKLTMFEKAPRTVPRIKKADIGKPRNFQHISHVGFDPDKGFEMDNVNPDLRNFFYKSGVTEEHLRDPQTRKFIYNFIDEQGGIESVIHENDSPVDVSKSKRANIPEAPPRLSAETQPRRTVRATQAPVKRPPVEPPATPPRNPTRIVKRREGLSSKPLPSPSSPNSSIPAPPPLPPEGLAPPAPPPMPPLGTPPLAPSRAPPPRMTEYIESDVRDGRGKDRSNSSVERGDSGPMDSRDALLSQIREGRELRHVESQSPLATEAKVGGIAGALAAALEARSKVIHSSSSSCDSDETSDSDDDWDD